MAVRLRGGRNECRVDDVFDFEDGGTITRLRIESHTVRPRSRPDPFGRRPTKEYPAGLLERLRIRVALTR